MATSFRIDKIETSGDHILWTLAENPEREGDHERSPYFEFAGRVWVLEAEVSRNNWLSLALKNYSDGSANDLVSLGLKVDGRYMLRSAVPDESGRIFSAQKVIMIDEVHISNTQLLPGGVLTVVCKITVQEPKQEKRAKHHLKEKSITKLQLDFQEMLDVGASSDVVLRVGGRDFHAHRNVLSARSGVFSKMLFHGMKEKITGIVTIQDSDPEVFSDFLHYLYTGSTDRITLENVQELYVAADKYQVSELQTQCVFVVERNLADENVAEFVNLGLRHNDRELIEAVMRFLTKKAEALP